jgi:hypothetical protein
MSITATLTTEDIFDAFATCGRVLPRAALEQARDDWPEVGSHLLAELEAAANGALLTERAETILMFGIYLMAQVRETRAFPLLCSAAARGDLLDRVIGDGITEDLATILASTFDGDIAPLRRLIEDEAADEFVRDASLDALSWLTATGRIDRDETARYLRDISNSLQPRDVNYVWVGWQEAIARLGLQELAPLVEEKFECGWIQSVFLGLEHFHAALQAALQASDPTKSFDDRFREDKLEDLAAYLSGWSGFQPEWKPARAATTSPVMDWSAANRTGKPIPPALSAPTARAPAYNPYRHVGRNDPCPCGSGKKFKKCCLN